MAIKVKIREQSRRMVVDYTPSGNRYTFFQGKSVGVRPDFKEDLKYFRESPRYEVESVKTVAKKLVDGVKSKLEETSKEEQKEKKEEREEKKEVKHKKGGK